MHALWATSAWTRRHDEEARGGFAVRESLHVRGAPLLAELLCVLCGDERPAAATEPGAEATARHSAQASRGSRQELRLCRRVPKQCDAELLRLINEPSELVEAPRIEGAVLEDRAHPWYDPLALLVEVRRARHEAPLG